MKITYLLNSTRMQNGATKSFLTLLESATDAGVTPTVVVPDGEGICDELRSKGIDVLILNYRPAVYPWLDSIADYLLFVPRLLGRLYLNRKAAIQLAKYLQKNKTDIIHTNVSVIDIGFKAAKKLNVPHIYHIREYADKDFNLSYYPNKRHFTKQLLSADSYSICITNDIQRHNNQQQNPRSVVVYNGICPTMPHGENVCSRGDYFLFAGRLEEAKGLDILMRGYVAYASGCDKEPLPLYLAGDISGKTVKQDIENVVAANGMKEKVCFLGVRTDIEEIMKHARAIIIPSRFEAFGRCMPEAMLCGCLAIARNTGGTLEQLENGKRLMGHDIALRFDNAAQLADMLARAEKMTDEEYCGITGKAREVVTKLYSKDTYAASILSFYKKILSDKASFDNKRSKTV
ncbi:glycosyltransferase [Prevotella sp. OH937_COT-195]|uniref:glycosyltransferase n=1 Tax=Prevotella sp. OH937_COT-195 TaxID=2491051 RepID=UPI000F651B16|nr:glycosyltransferase [Prevotella sp. OH937_COT-195]RRD02773.1 glycosyltransferase [Prevotella sp. OH937_COT-195]